MSIQELFNSVHIYQESDIEALSNLAGVAVKYDLTRDGAVYYIELPKGIKVSPEQKDIIKRILRDNFDVVSIKYVLKS